MKDELVEALRNLPKHTLWAIGSMEEGPFARVILPNPNGGYTNGYGEAFADTVPEALDAALAKARAALKGRTEPMSDPDCEDALQRAVRLSRRSPPNALLPTEEVEPTAAVANAIAPMLYGAAFKDLNGDYQIDCRAIANVAINTTLAALSPDGAVTEAFDRGWNAAIKAVRSTGGHVVAGLVEREYLAMRSAALGERWQ